MKRLLRVLAALVLAVLLGLGSAYLTVIYGGRTGVVTNGPWETNLETGGTGAGAYTRAFVALTSLFALTADEAIYYNTTLDSAGEALDGSCSYRVEGRDPDARWWSLTAYTREHFLIDTPSRRYAVDKSGVGRADDGSFAIALSAVAVDGDWIAIERDRFELSLRLYNPGPTVRDNPGGVPLPAIVKTGCP